MEHSDHRTGRRLLCGVAALLLAILSLAFAGCGKKEERENPADEATVTAQPEEERARRVTIHTGENYIAALKEDGTVMFAGDSDSFAGGTEWTDIVELGTGDGCASAVKKDGTAVAADSYAYIEKRARMYAVGTGLYWKDILDSFADQYENGSPVEGWTDIVAISTGYLHIVGLKKDGTVVACGWNADGQCNVSGWTDIVAISAGGNRTVGLKKDGTAVECGQTFESLGSVSEWTDLIAVDTSRTFTAGLKKDGTVVCTYNMYKVTQWTDIVEVYAGDGYVAGLRKDGTVVVHSLNYVSEHQKLAYWTDIVAIGADGYIAGLKKDGTVVIFDSNEVRGEIAGWKNIQLP